MTTRTTAPFEQTITAATNGSAPVPAGPPQPRRRRARWAALVGAGLTVALLAFVYDPRNLFEPDGTEPEAVLRETSVVTVTSLTERHDVDGTIGFAESTTLTRRSDAASSAAAAGPGASTATSSSPASTVTQLVAAGSDVGQGDVLWRVGLEPTVALIGTEPAYRTLDRDTEGPDVEQLESSLVALGFDPDGTVTVDEAFTANTEAMVERWQDALGAEVTGEVALTSVVYIDAPSRIGAVHVAVGDAVQDGSAMLDLTARQRELRFTVPAAERETLTIGATVVAQLPDRTTVSATVESMTINETGGATVSATLDEDLIAGIDSVPVTISWSETLGDDLLTVPAAAVYRTDSGQYWVEVRNPDGTEQAVPVEVITTSDGLVAISGPVARGDQVITP